MTDKHKGMLFAFLQACMWSMLPVLAIIGFQTVDAAFTLAVTTTLGALFFALVVTWQQVWHETGVRQAYPFILANTFLNAFLYMGLIFWGSSLTSPGNVAIILRMENFFSIVLLGGIGFDKISRQEVLGGMLMIVGAMIVVFPGTFRLQTGDLLILMASVLPVFGNVCSKKARQFVSSSVIMFIRTLLAAPLFWGIVWYKGSFPEVLPPASVMLALFINGFIVMGLARLVWIEAIHLIPISTGNSIGSIGPLLTLCLSYLLLSKEPSFWQLSAVLPMIVGLNLLIRAAPQTGDALTEKRP